ncbi:hybrid cluster protein [Caldicellulosiruptor saccharolyticus DSM 8903]|uniref:Hydroxylamine reductase n=1 Tax=Caldicellulosiruptor saccharolyticus (strain ATCC 43494 / DSM 8903 / Tp8T 6331) TaxID=351627 RepID=A4XJY0_CALS8|nr:hydroxylamine reductase [Caldicellulosiruptor saccharolyticus]ABP67215.1 hybrid cluster protein [Caldicellulosiruptor saccharolyticus DSM 8903]
MLQTEMFCFQCEQTAGGKGCTRVGVCGKDSRVANLQDLLLYQLKGIAYLGDQHLKQGKKIDQYTTRFMMDALFSTLTNVNFDEKRFVEYILEAQTVKENLKNQVGSLQNVPAAVDYRAPEDVEKMIEDGKKVGILADEIDEDIRSLRELLIYGIKGMAAYAHHAARLGKQDENVNNFFFTALARTLDNNISADELFNLCMELGKMNFRCMQILDEAHTQTFGHPQPTEVLISKKKGPFIIVSGHDLKDLKDLLEQTEGKGINIYTHGEMLPAHGYPELKKYKHLVGNYGGAWQDQQKEFDGIPGCILMTTNCLQKPKDSYKDRIFTTGVVGFDGVAHIEEVDGKKDFTPIIQKALELGGWQEDEEEKKILVGFGHHTVLGLANKIIDAVKSGQIKHFFLIGGCDGARSGRNYYTEFAEKTPKDTLILTLACGKYRFNKKDFGTIGEFPRLLDIGQCNDAYSALVIAIELAKVFNCDVNDLPLTLVLSWFEQKAVAILLTLLSLGLKNIYLGPSLPAFVSPNILQVLVEKFNIKPISNPEKDLNEILSRK